MISNRFPRANNPYMHEAYDPSKLTKYITYPDANNLYGWAMGQPLPIGGFKWMTVQVDDHVDEEKLLIDLNDNFMVKREFGMIAGGLSLKHGRYMAIASAALLTPSLKFFQWQLSLSHWLDCNNNNNNNLPIYIARIYMC